MAISVSSIMSKLNAYAKTSEGQKKMDDKIQAYRKGADPRVAATGKTYGGGSIMNEKEMISAAKELIAMVRSAAATAGLPASVMEHIESLDYTTPFINADGSASIQIYMSDSPHRDSLMPQKYGGVENIVAIFNSGYSADGRVYGAWHGKKIASLPERSGSFFMQKAINAFEAKYGNKYDVSVELSQEYGGALSGDLSEVYSKDFFR